LNAAFDVAESDQAALAVQVFHSIRPSRPKRLLTLPGSIFGKMVSDFGKSGGFAG